MNVARYFRSAGAAARIATAPLGGRRLLFLGLLALAPVSIPILVGAFRHGPADWGLELYSWVAEFGFLGTLAPLAAIFLATALVGEDVENGTAAYLLTRAAPRSALVVGKLGAYAGIVAGVFLPAMGLTYVSAATLGGARLADGASIFARTFGVVCLAILAYGALCCALGALGKRPVILGVVWVFGWEPLTRLVPGYVDFFTIKKHLLALWPVVALGARGPGSVEVARKVIDVGRGEAAAYLALATIALAAVTTLTLRRKEFVRGQNLA